MSIFKPVEKPEPGSEGVLKPEQTQQLKKRLLQQYEAALDARLAKFPTDRVLTLDEIEEIAQEVRDEVGKTLGEEIAKEITKACDRARHPQKHPCKSCGKAARRRGEKARTIVTMAGEVPVKRRIYYCRRCDLCTAPLDKEMRLPEHGYSRQVEREVARVCTADAFERGVQDLKRLARVSVSATEAQRITLAVGEYAQKSTQRDVENAFIDPENLTEQLHEPTVTIYIFLDGIHTPLRKGFKESKVGCVCIETQSGKRKTYYTHHLGGPTTIGNQLYALAARAGVAECARVVAIGDGAPWIWRQIKLRFPHAVQILDFYHASEHLHAVVKSCMEASEIKEGTAAKVWADEALKQMRAGKIDQLMEMIKALPAPDPNTKAGHDARKIRRNTINYLSNNRERMKYDEYEKKGWSIGSGQIESGCKQVVGKRMKGAGMRWTEPMAKAMGTLRALLLSHNLWDIIINQWPGRGTSPIASF